MEYMCFLNYFRFRIGFRIYFVLISGLNSPECSYLLFVVLDVFIPVIAVDVLFSDSESSGKKLNELIKKYHIT